MILLVQICAVSPLLETHVVVFFFLLRLFGTIYCYYYGAVYSIPKSSVVLIFPPLFRSVLCALDSRELGVYYGSREIVL